MDKTSNTINRMWVFGEEVLRKREFLELAYVRDMGALGLVFYAFYSIP